MSVTGRVIIVIVGIVTALFGLDRYRGSRKSTRGNAAQPTYEVPWTRRLAARCASGTTSVPGNAGTGRVAAGRSGSPGGGLAASTGLKERFRGNALTCHDEDTASQKHEPELAALRAADGLCDAITSRAESIRRHAGP